jgi:uncharacterized protein
VKRTDAPRVTPSMRSAIETLALDQLTVVHAGKRTFDLPGGVQALAAVDVVRVLKPLRR